MLTSSKNRGFSLIELVVVVSILAILAGVMVPRVSRRMAEARDARRMQDMRTVQQAVERYYIDKGTYPLPNTNPAYGGWDVSHDGDFVQELVDTGYLPEVLLDPIDNDTFHYRYFVYSEGSYSCEGKGPFYVLGIRNFETDAFEQKNVGWFRCTGRDWGGEFAYVTGAGATFSQ